MKSELGQWVPTSVLNKQDDDIAALRAENERLKDALRIAYQHAWNIEQKSQEPFSVLRAKEIKKATMDALKEANGTKVA